MREGGGESICFITKQGTPDLSDAGRQEAESDQPQPTRLFRPSLYSR